MMYVTIVAITLVLAAIFWFLGMRRSAVFYGAVFAVGGYSIAVLPAYWLPIAAIGVSLLTTIGFVWQWVRLTRDGAKFPWNRTSVRGLTAMPFAASVNLLALPDVVAGMGVPAITEAFDESFGIYLSAVAYLLTIYLVPRIIDIVRHLLAPKVASE